MTTDKETRAEILRLYHAQRPMQALQGFAVYAITSDHGRGGMLS